MTRLLLIYFCFTSIFFFSSCDNNRPAEKNEQWAIVINFFTPDISFYPQSKEFPFPDTLRFSSLERIFTNGSRLPTITDSTIIYYDYYTANGLKQCCRKDTLELYTDTINGKKYLFAIGDYVAVFQSNEILDSNLRTRKESVADQLLDIKLNVPYPSVKFKEEIEKLGTRRVKLSESINEVYKQKWAENDSILVETIQFSDSTERIITAIYKDMDEAEANSAIAHIQNKFPGIHFEEALEPGDDGQPFRRVRMDLHGVSISLSQTGTKQYAFMITDLYETIRLILKNAGTNYIFRDDLRIY